MDRLKRAAFPLIILLIIIVMLIVRLASCTTSPVKSGSGLSSASPVISGSASSSANTPGANASGVNAAGVLSSPAPSPSASGNTAAGDASPSPEINYTNDDIMKVFKKAGYDVKEIRDAGSATAVQFCSHDAPAGDKLWKFAWFNRTTGAHDVVGDGLLTDKFEITADKTLMVLSTGRDFSDGKQWFPEIWMSRLNDGSEVVRYDNESWPYFMPVAQSFTLSDSRSESLAGITFDFDAVSVGFVPQPGHESEFETAYRYIPRTSIVYNDGCLYITFYNTTLSSAFKEPAAGAGDNLRSFVSVKSDGTNALLTLKLGTRADRYNVSMAYSPDTGMPYAVFKFRSNDSIYPPYPTGW